MVIKKDPLKVLDMLSKPVDVDEDEFLNTLDATKSFNAAPSKPAGDIGNVGMVMNDQQQGMLSGIADVEVEEEDLEGVGQFHPAPGHEHDGVTLTDKEQRFFALFGQARKTMKQGAVPDDVDLQEVAASENALALPHVGDTPEEVEARKEDQERRAAYVQEAAKMEHKGNTAVKKAHENFVANFDAVENKH